MKVSAWPSLIVCWLCGGWLAWPLNAASQQLAPSAARARLLIVEAGPEDREAAARLDELTGGRLDVVRWPQRGEAAEARAWMDRAGAARGVVLDTRARRVAVLEGDGRTRTREIDGEPTPYLMAFVATELLALDAPRPADPVPAPAAASAAPQPPPATRVARISGGPGFEVSRPYTTAWLYRPKLLLDLWLRASPAGRWRVSLAGDLAGPGWVEREVMEGGRLSLLRWDTSLRLGAALPLASWRFVFAGHARAGVQRARYTGTLGVEERSVSLGFGAGLSAECKLGRYTGLVLGTDLAIMPRRAAFTIHDELLLRESLLFFSATLTLVFGSAPPL